MSSMHITNYCSTSRLPAWFVLAVVLVVADATSTSVALLSIDNAAEANPVIAMVIASVGVLPAMILKLTFGVVLALFLTHCAHEGYPFAFMQRNWRLQRVTRGSTAVRAHRMLWFFTAAHGLVVVNNIIVIITRS